MHRSTRERLDFLLQRSISPLFVCAVHAPGHSLERLVGAAYCIGRTMFETDRMPPEWVQKCNEMDEIWVPSAQNLESLRRSGVTVRVTRIPAGVDAERFRPGLTPLSIPGCRKKVFLSVFEWIYRKGWDVLLRAWARAFKGDDDVCLVLRTYPFNEPDRPDARK